ncbi:MAG: hypothetical protein RLZZ403_997 [Pseudomonadota bacterium]|jgi:hypothetical protein
MTTKKAYNKLGRAEQDQLNTFLKTICEKDEDGFAIYSNGWDDDKACDAFSAKLGREVSLLTIGGTRRDLFGNFRPRGRTSKTVSHDAIEKVTARQDAQIVALSARLDRIEKYLRLPTHPADTLFREFTSAPLGGQTAAQADQPPLGALRTIGRGDT